MKTQDIYCTKNECYQNNAKLKSVSYLIVHSPSVYPAIIRAVSGSDNWYKRWNKSGVEKLVHGFIDDTGVYNFAPYTMACWHVGNSYGNANTIGYELCEFATESEFKNMWNNAINHYANLCKTYGLSVDKIIGHQEGYKKGIASNHSDPEPYFKRFGKDMNKFRAEVQAILSGFSNSSTTPVINNKKTISGTITILSEINTRKLYSFEDNAVVGKACTGEQHHVIESSVVDGTLMYRTPNNRYVSGATKYVKFQSGIDTRITYKAHCQSYGDLSYVANGCVSGTVGEAKRLEAITINSQIPLEYRVHCQTYGWMDWLGNGKVAGIIGKAKRLEAIQIKRKDGGNIKYRVHMQTYGWGPWAKNGETAGTIGEARRVEAIQIVLE